MTTVYQNPALQGGPATPKSYSTYQQPDTRIPPKARPVMAEISVGGVSIAEDDVLKEAQNHPAKNPGEALFEAARALVVRELLWQQAQRLDVQSVPEPDDEGRMETQKDAAIRTLIEQQVHVPKATDAECLRNYRMNRHRHRSEPIYEARHILLAAPEGDAKARRAADGLAKNIIEELSAHPERFGLLAQRYSACPSHQQNGNLGQLTRGSTVAEFERALETMEEGDLSATPVASRFGYHVIALDRKIPGRQLPFDLVKDRIAAWLEASAWSRAVSQYIAILAGEAKITGIDINAAYGPLVQ